MYYYRQIADPQNYYYSRTIMNPTFTHDASGLKYYAHMMVRDQFRKPPGAIFSGNFLAVTVILLKLSLKDLIHILWTMEKKYFQNTFKKYNIHPSLDIVNLDIVKSSI